MLSNTPRRFTTTGPVVAGGGEAAADTATSGSAIDEKAEVETPFIVTHQPGQNPDQSATNRRMDSENLRRNVGGMGCCCCLGISGLVGVIAVSVAMMVSSFHFIDEGMVGIYYKYGALQNETSEPGMHTMQPFVTTVKQIMIRSETDHLGSISAITQDGIQISFDGVQVISTVNRSHITQTVKDYGLEFKKPLVFDRVREDIRIFCANNTIDDVYNTRFLDIVNAVRTRLEMGIEKLGGGVKIINLVIPKPEIPPDIANNYKQVKVQWTEQLVAKQQQNTEEIKKKTELIRAIADAERTKKVLEISIQESIMKHEGEQNVSRIANSIVKEREENLANIEKFKRQTEAEANRQLYTPEFVQLSVAKAIANNTKFYFSGDQGPLGALLTKLIN